MAISTILRRELAVVPIVVVVLIGSACSTHKLNSNFTQYSPAVTASPPSPSNCALGDVMADLQALSVPDGVDNAIFEALREELAKQLTAVYESKYTSMLPGRNADHVRDLAISENEDKSFTLSWHYRNPGDYDQNGIVNVSDITPLAMHFGERVPENDTARNSIQAVIDGSENGIVDIADITPIVINLFSEISLYEVEKSQPVTAAFEDAAVVDIEDFAGDGRKLFTYQIALARRAMFRVVARDSDGNIGNPSEPVELRIENGSWRMHAKDPRHLQRSPYVGPQAPTIVRSFEPSGTYSWNLVVDGEGTTYAIVCSGSPSLLAIKRDGSLLWKYTDEELITFDYSSPAISEDGTVYFASITHLYAINGDGTLRWKAELPSQCYFSSPTIGPDGTIYTGTADGMNETADGYLIAFNSDGTLKWKYLVGNDIISTAAIGEDGTVYTASYEGVIIALNPDGNLRWSLQAGDSGAIWSSPTLGVDGTLYIGIQGGRWASTPDYDLGYLYAITPDGSLKWKYETIGWVSSCPALAEDGTVYFGSVGGYFYAVNPDGTLKWSFQMDSNYFTSPAVGGDGTIYFSPQSGPLYALKPDGTILWTSPISDEGIYGGNPIIGEDGSLYIASGQSCIMLSDGL